MPVWVKSCKTSGCHFWKGSHDRRGYGRFLYEGRLQNAHCVAYQLFVDKIPLTIKVLHTCDNSLCVNPDHLELGTQKKNMEDASSRGRLATGEDSHWAKLTWGDVRKIRTMQGTQKEIAQKFNVSRATIHLILADKTWKERDDEQS
jgi:hypothetical protein